MQRFRLEFHSLRPDGRWYFVGPGGEDPCDSEDGGYRVSDTEHYPRQLTEDEEMKIAEVYDEPIWPDLDYTFDYDPDMFRVKPCRERIEPLLAAFAKSLTGERMPSLEDAEICTHLFWNPNEDKYLGRKYDLPGKQGHRWGVKLIAGRVSETQNNGDTVAADPTPPVVQWQVGDWRTSKEVLDFFESLGREEWLDLEWCKSRKTELNLLEHRRQGNYFKTLESVARS